MRLQVVIFVVTVLAACALSSSYAQDESIEQPHRTDVSRSDTENNKLFSFDFFVKRFKKHYPSAVEALVRQKIFLGRAFRVFVSGIKYRFYKVSHYLSINPSSDETPEERAKRYINPENFRSRPSPTRLNSHIEIKPEPSDVPLAEIEDIEREMKEIEQRKDEPGYQELAEEMERLQSQNSRRKRETSARRGLKMEDLIEPAEDSVEASAEVEAKIRLRVPSNNPNYEQPELSSSSAGDAESIMSHPISKSVLNVLSFMPGANYVKSVVSDVAGSISQHNEREDLSELPDEVFVDLRETGCFFQPRRQGNCGSCWAFTAIAMYEYLFCKETGNLIPFSEQFLVDCGGVFNLHGCDGGDLRFVALFVDSYGLELRSNYPYRYTNDSCPYEDHLDPTKTGYIKLRDPSSANLMHSAIGWYLKNEQKPVMVPLNLPKDFYDYGGGVADGIECGANGGHGMLIVGHGREDGKEYYLFRNSHSVSWGERGHYKFNKDDIEKCAIAEGVVSRGNFEKFDSEVKNPNYHDQFVKQRYAEYLKKGASGQVKELI